MNIPRPTNTTNKVYQDCKYINCCSCEIGGDEKFFVSKDCWAKTDKDGNVGTNLYSHSVATAEIAIELLKQKSQSFNVDFKQYLKYLPFLASIHDVGKISPDFQAKCQDWLQKHSLPPTDYISRISQNARHSDYSKDALLKTLKTKKSVFAEIIGAHHGKLSKAIYKDSNYTWSDERNAFISAMSELYDTMFLDADDDKIPQDIWIILTGFITLCDWIASDEKFFPNDKSFDKYQIESIAKDLFNREESHFAFGAQLKHKDVSQIFDFELNDLQNVSLEIAKDKGLYLIESPMGSGKTEAALLIAQKLIVNKKASGIYFGLPTKTTSNKIYERIRDFLESLDTSVTSARLVHSSSWLNDMYVNCDTKYKAQWFNSPRRALLFPFGVGTIDQALMAILPVKQLFLRNASLADKVIILDEIHSYDSYTSGLIKIFANRLQAIGSSLVILSATLSKNQRADILGCNYIGNSSSITAKYYNDEPIVSTSIKLQNDTIFKIEKISDNDSIDKAVQLAKSGLCVLFICNTVRTAQEVYRRIKDIQLLDNYEFQLGLLHSKFTLDRRNQLEQYWLNVLGKDRTNRPSTGAILVSTQIVEQSVDIDADAIITQICPIDMFLQRMGRCFRHKTKRHINAEEPIIYASIARLDNVDFENIDTDIDSLFGNSAKIYDKYILLKTALLLESITEIKIPSDIENLIDNVYSDDSTESPLLNKLHNELLKSKDELSEKAISATSHLDLATDDNDHTNTRIIDVPTTDCLFVTKDNNYIKLLSGYTIDTDSQSLKYFKKQIAENIALNTLKIPSYILQGYDDNINDSLHIYTSKINTKVIDISERINGYEIKYCDKYGLSYQKFTDKKSTPKTLKESFEEFTNYEDDQ